MSFDDLPHLIAVVYEELDSGIDGVVITQGTDTIEETAYFLDLTLDRAAPLVVPPSRPLPASTWPVGCVVVIADEIHAAKHVHKMHSASPGAFASPKTGPIGRVVEGHPRLIARPMAAPTYPSPTRGVRIGLITACLGDDAELLRRLGSGFDGLVIAGFGVGHVPGAFVDPLAEVASRIPVVFASRTVAGPVLRST